jgi:AraC family transcriptional regulator, transcriptional activator of pobA
MPASTQSLDYIDFYGETTQLDALLFCEALSERSQQHDWKILPHRHRYIFQLFFVADGGGQVHLDEHQYSLQAPAMLIIPPGVMHSFEWHKGSQGVVVSVAEALLQQSLQKMGVNHVVSSAVLHPLTVTELGVITHLYSQLLAEQQQADEYTSKLQLLLLEQLLIWCGRTLHIRQAHTHVLSKPEIKLQQFQQLVNQAFTLQHQVAWYAGQIGVSQSHLNQICQRYTGAAALAVIHRQLLHEAKRYLIFSDLSLSDISEQLGFAEPSYFSKFFKRLAGVQPARYRQLNRG